MGVQIIDAHLHLWERQNGQVNGKPVFHMEGGRSDFGGEIRQMLPPYLFEGKNNVEALIANMDYAGVNACVATQEVIDGNQDKYLLRVKEKYPDRIKICKLFEEDSESELKLDGFDGLKICASRLHNEDLSILLPVFQKVEQEGKFISIDLEEGVTQVEAMQNLVANCPNLRIAIGHFGMVTRKDWVKQIALAKNKNVFIESGGITWLFHDEFYPYPSAIEAILRAIEICGIEKLMWGSDYPRTMVAITYKMSFDFIQKTNQLTTREKELFLGENAKRFYGFKELKPIRKIKSMVE